MESFTGKKFGRLLVIEYSHTDKHRSRYFKCVCDCGNESTVKSTALKIGTTKSCGCLQKEIVSSFAKNNNYKKRKTHINNFTRDRNGFICAGNYSLNIKNFIYKLTNLINNKMYVGKSERTLKLHLQRYNRFINKNSKSKSYIQNALRKYGLSNFKFEIIEICNGLDINEREKFYIKNLNTNKTGYNLTTGGEGIIGYVFTESHKKKISDSRIGKFCGENNPFFNKTHSEETRNKIIESNKRRKGEVRQRKIIMI